MEGGVDHGVKHAWAVSRRETSVMLSVYVLEEHIVYETKLP